MNAVKLRIETAEGAALKVGSAPRLALNLEGSGGTTTNYNALTNKPSIEGHTLVGDSTLQQIGVGDITPQEIDRIIYG